MPARRFLAAKARQGDGHGYLSRPQRMVPDGDPNNPQPVPPEEAARVGEARTMCDEPESPSAAWVDAESEMAAQRNTARLLRQAEEAQRARETVSMANRLRDAERRAKRNPAVDPEKELFLVRKMLARGKVEAALARLLVLEDKLDGVEGLKAS